MAACQLVRTASGRETRGWCDAGRRQRARTRQRGAEGAWRCLGPYDIRVSRRRRSPTSGATIQGTRQREKERLIIPNTNHMRDVERNSERKRGALTFSQTVPGVTIPSRKPEADGQSSVRTLSPFDVERSSLAYRHFRATLAAAPYVPGPFDACDLTDDLRPRAPSTLCVVHNGQYTGSVDVVVRSFHADGKVEKGVVDAKLTGAKATRGYFLRHHLDRVQEWMEKKRALLQVR